LYIQGSFDSHYS